MTHRATTRLVSLCIVTLLLSAGSTTASAQTARSCNSAPVDDILQRRLHDARVAAGALVVVRRGKIDYSGGYGQDAPGGQPVDPTRTVFRAASNGKPLIATAVLQLVTEGRLDLHADINTYLPLFKIPATFDAPVTLDALLTHSSGFDDHFLGALARNQADLIPLGPYLASHLPSRVAPPGEQIIYSNHAMAMAAYVVEAVSGEDFAGYAQRHILDPLGMTSSTFDQPPTAEVAQRLVRTSRGPAPFLDPYPAGSLVATAMDMARLIAGQLGSPLDGAAPVLPETARALMLDQHFTPYPGMPGAAYDYFQSDANGHPSLHHTGDGGDHSLIYLVPGANLGFYLVYTAPDNEDPSTPREQIARDLIDHYLGCAQPFKQRPARTEFAQRADRYVGTFRINTYSHDTVEKLAALGQEIVVTNPGDGSLSVVLGGGSPLRLVESSPNLFRDPDGAYVAFHSGIGGDITALSFTAAGVDDPGSAHRIRWWETAQANLLFCLLIAILLLIRAASGVATHVLRRRGEGPHVITLAWRVSGWISIALVTAGLVAAGTVITAGGVITDVPLGINIALVLLNLSAILGALLVVATVNDLIRRRGLLRQRLVLGAAALGAIAALPFLAYWNLLGLRY